MIDQFAWFALGLFILGLGADSLLKGAAGLALRFGISPFMVGLVIVGFGTSMPELAVNMSAAWSGSYDIALGNVVGSNIANIGLILGSAAIMAPLAVHMRLLKVETPLMIAAGVVLWIMCLDGHLGRIDGLILLAIFIAIGVYIIRSAKQEPNEVKQEIGDTVLTKTDLWQNIFRVVLGLVMLILGAQFMVDAAIVIARLLGLSELIIGLTVVAIGTSLPELAAAILAAKRGQSDVVMGNIVGSNLFNILLILGATSSLHPLPVARSLEWVEFPAMIAFSLLLLPMMRGDLKISRNEGMVLVTAYFAFLGLQAWLAMG